jgi:hypothetical protein
VTRFIRIVAIIDRLVTPEPDFFPARVAICFHHCDAQDTDCVVRATALRTKKEARLCAFSNDLESIANSRSRNERDRSKDIKRMIKARLPAAGDDAPALVSSFQTRLQLPPLDRKMPKPGFPPMYSFTVHSGAEFR